MNLYIYRALIYNVRDGLRPHISFADWEIMNTMINEPLVIAQTSFQLAWKEVVSVLSINGWELRNLIVHIKNPIMFDCDFHQEVRGFCREHSLLDPKDVAYTIFPHRLYDKMGDAERLFHSYNRAEGMYEKLQRRPRSGWGTYFRRMTHYECSSAPVNQLENIIESINSRTRNFGSAYTVVIQKPGTETVLPMGGPCLNYIAIQIENADPVPILGMLCIYRNHDFLGRAYGNYWGLCNLARFLTTETGFAQGPITCISSHAYINGAKKAIRCLLKRL
jgi:thymidylate synthase